MNSPLGAGTGFFERSRTNQPSTGFSFPSDSYGSQSSSSLFPPSSPSPSTPRRSGGYMPSHLFPERNSKEDETPSFRPDQSPYVNRDYSYPYSKPSTPQTWSTPSVSRSLTLDKPSAPLATSTKRDKEEFAPPVLSIYDTDLAITENPPLKTDFPSHEPIGRPEPTNGIRSAASPQLHDTIFKDSTSSSSTTKQMENDDRWVTVFGFPQQYTSNVLKQFQKYGDIIRYRSGEGNWMNIQYQTRLQAQKALTKNGKIIDDGIMIGVVSLSNRRMNGGGTTNIPSTPFASGVKYTSGNSNFTVEPMVPKTIPIPQNSLWYKITEFIFGV